MQAKYIIALDQGTTSSRAVLFNRQGNVVHTTQNSFPQIYPHPGWVEHNPYDILSSQLDALRELMLSKGLSPSDIAGIGITNQRETTIVWDRRTGKPVSNAIVWQCRRSAPIIDALCKAAEIARTITEKTGLIPDAYFSASKIKWILDNVAGARKQAEAGNLAFGTVDSWLIWALTEGHLHITDTTNASRTMLFNIHTTRWDPWLLDLFEIPASMLPEVHPSSAIVGYTATGHIPVGGVAGDQQAALFGQCCFKPGQAKNTYGTGCFLLMHTGHHACTSSNNLITTLCASAPNVKDPEYALEGSVFVAGALVQWLRDEMGLVASAEETEAVATSVVDTGGVYMVPAFTGLGAPHWDAQARGAVYGLTRGTTRAHFVRAALESLAYQVHDLVEAMQADAHISLSELKVDGGAAANNFLMQFQADILQACLYRPNNTETTAQGAAYLAGLATGFWSDIEQICSLQTENKIYLPHMSCEVRERLLQGWSEAVGRTMTNRRDR